MTTDLSGTRALVFGAGTPVGRAVAVALAEAGADVCVASLTRERDDEFATNSVANEIWAVRGSGSAFVVDAGEPSDIEAALDAAARDLGALTLVVIAGEEPVVAAATAAKHLNGAGAGRVIIVLPSEGGDPQAAAAGVVGLAKPDASSRPGEVLVVEGTETTEM